MSTFFIAGTDTGVGKTHVTCTLLHALQARNLSVCGMKPVASGCVDTPEGLRNEDGLALQAASSAPMPYEWINPMTLREPLSPHLAAAHDGVEIQLAPLLEGFERLRDMHDVVLVEGVGGWLVPLSRGLLAADIPRQWQLPVILVVGMRLGCINHALLTARAIATDGCRLVGWIGNLIDPQMAAVQENLDTLRQLLPAPCLGVLPYGESPRTAAAKLDVASILE